jgi:Ca-activated chloride channel homolog
LALEIARDIRSQYTIAYSPSIQALDGSYRQIKVTVEAPGKPVVRTRSGYYAGDPAKSASARPAPVLKQ